MSNFKVQEERNKYDPIKHLESEASEILSLYFISFLQNKKIPRTEKSVSLFLRWEMVQYRVILSRKKATVFGSQGLMLYRIDTCTVHRNQQQEPKILQEKSTCHFIT